MFCGKCGKLIPAANAFCSSCGSPRENSTKTKISLPKFELPNQNEILSGGKNIRLFVLLLSIVMVLTLLLPWLSVSQSVTQQFSNLSSGYSPLQTITGFGRVGEELNGIWDTTAGRRAQIQRRLNEPLPADDRLARDRIRLEESDRNELRMLNARATSTFLLRFSMTSGLVILLFHSLAIYRLVTSSSTEKLKAYQTARFANRISMISVALFLAFAFYAFSTLPNPRSTWISISIVPWLALGCSIAGMIISNKGIKEDT